FSSLGLDTSTAIRMFLTMSVENNGLPFTVQHNTNYSLKQAMLDSETLTNLSGTFKGAKDTVVSMLED
ncbi:MAG: type II toxin-antitoxin system RelB/DinJ family antitoxin, partial [Sphaerochaetaceae bacterium]|nr:type II toxin-antitoxin system RelB/DinJ family antitoxin [Sphaerochaetaceae bacterium]